VAGQASVTITGIAAIREQLAPERLRAVLTAAIAEALAPIVTSARALAPRGRTGTLARSIRAVVGRRRGETTTATILSGVSYAHLVEYGHRLVVGGRVARAGRFVPLSFRSRFTGQVIGQVAPHPFARPAFEAHAVEMAQTIEDRLVAALNAP
jgi:hypothetical protein